MSGADNPRITTIIPSYNHAEYVSEAIESVLAQEYDNHELIVIDDGSQDGSADVIGKYADHPLVTAVINKKNRGQSAVLLQALDMATGRFIALLPSDDWLLPQRNRVQVNKFLEVGERVGIIYGNGLLFRDDSKEYVAARCPLLKGNLFEHLLLEDQVILPVTPLIRRECYDRFRPDPSVAAEGEGLWIKMAMEWHIDYVEEVVGVMRQHGRNTGRNWALTYRQNVDYWERFFADPGLPEHARALRRRALARVHRMYGLTFLRDAGDPAMARQALLASARERPMQLLLDWRLSSGIILAMAGLGRVNPDRLLQAARDG